jgi:aryl-alcohol dehydrogenase-like predicted oxidoreductase
MPAAPPAPAARASADRLGLGLAALGRPAYHTLDHGRDVGEDWTPPRLEARAHAVLDAARAAGVPYVDAARSYGRAEEFVRRWLETRGIAPGALELGSKWGYRYVGDWRLDAAVHEVKDHSLAALRAQAAESRVLLGPWLSRYQIHSATADGPVLRDGAVLDELARLRDGGWRIGVTVSGPGQADAVARALEIERGGAPLFDSIQATWNLLERACEVRLAEAHAAGRLVIVKEPLANGRLTARGDAGGAGPVAAAAAARGVGPDAIALAAALARPWAGRVLLGPATVAQLRSNLRALDVALTAQERAALDGLAEAPEGYWRRRAGLRWT